MWRFVEPAFRPVYRTVLFDHVGAGGSDLTAYDRARYDSLAGYADDVIEICEALDLRDVVFVGHSVSAMIGVLVAIRAPERVGALVLVGPSPRYLDDEISGYVGGFSKADIAGLLEALDSNYLGWASAMAQVVMGRPDRPDLAAELEQNFCRTDPAIARHFAEVTFLSDNRHDLPRVSVPTLVLQASVDAIAGPAVGRYVHRLIDGSDFVMLDATGHCPHLSAPDETIGAMLDFLGSDVTPLRAPASADALAEQAPCGFLTTAPDGTVTEVNTTILEWTGHRREDIVGTLRFAELLTLGGRAYYETHFAPLLSMHGVVKGIVVDLACLDGHVLPVLVHAVVSREGPDDSPLLTHVTLLDATHRRAYERELLAARQIAERSDRRVQILHRVVAETAVAGDRAAVVDTLVRVLSDVFDGAGAAIWLIDTEGCTLSLAGANGVPATLTPLLLPTDALPPAAAYREREPVMVDSAEQATREFPMLAGPLAHSPFGALTAVPIVAGHVTLGAYALYFGRSRFSDADEVELHRTLGSHAGQAIERATLYQDLRHAASHDPLTDLPNRTLFDDRVEQALARCSRTERPLAVMVVDLNGFKRVNDWLGHRAGDTVLAETAHRLRAAVRPHDSVARIGGDEFAVLCEDVDRAGTDLIAARIRTALEPEIPIGTDRVSATGSVGAVVYVPRPCGTPTTPAQLLHEADAAMYRAKAGGKDAAEVSHTALIGL